MKYLLWGLIVNDHLQTLIVFLRERGGGGGGSRGGGGGGGAGHLRHSFYICSVRPVLLTFRLPVRVTLFLIPDTFFHRL